jgi:SET domain-containing protein
MSKGKNVRFCVDAKDQGNFIRFINHSPVHPNVEVCEVPYKGRWYIAYVAAEDIPAGAQFLVDYGKNYWQDKAKKPAKLTP